jgi:hypothetical protein
MSPGALSGACNCGGVRFVLHEIPSRAGYCHCTRCQRRTGAAASAQARIDAATLTILSGAELLTGWRHPDGGFEKLFCSVCGSHLFSANPENPAEMSVRLGVIDGDPQVRPSFHQFTADAAVWEPLPEDGLERHSGAAR